MSSEARQRKMADRVKVIVAETLESRIKDPRLGFITITDVRVTPDLREASVFYTVYGDDEARQSTAAALASAKGVLRSEVGKQTGVKFTPTLEFFPDAIPETARQLEDLIRQAAEADAAVHAQAATAAFAGDPDPYRRPEPEDDDPAAAPTA
jgi:ribosome-binding factor A